MPSAIRLIPTLVIPPILNLTDPSMLEVVTLERVTTTSFPASEEVPMLTGVAVTIGTNLNSVGKE